MKYQLFAICYLLFYIRYSYSYYKYVVIFNIDNVKILLVRVYDYIYNIQVHNIYRYIAYCLLRIAYSYCLLPIACCLLPIP